MEEAPTLTLTPTFFFIFPLIGAFVVLLTSSVQIVRNSKRGISVGAGTYILSVLIIFFLGFLAFWCQHGYVDSTDLIWVQSSVALTLAGALLPLRDYIQARLDRFASNGLPQEVFSSSLRLVRDAAIIVLAAALARQALEIPWNDKIAELSGQSTLIEYAFILLAMGVTFFVGQRTPTGPIFVTLACGGVGIAQDFLIRFKAMPILPSDLLALETANEVANQYSYTLTTNDMRAVLYCSLALVLLCMLRPITIKNKNRLVLATIVNIVVALPFALALDWWIEVPDYRADYGYDLWYWRAAGNYKSQGFIPSFMTALQDLAIKEPEGYTEERAQQITQTYAAHTDAMPERSAAYAEASAQFNELQPSVVVVMNETFADLSTLDELRVGYKGPEFFNSLDDTLSRGFCGVSVYGGSTCNSEFEMLTGNSLSFVGSGKYPYQMYDFTKIDNLARQFKDLGYEATAIHPNLKNNWNRNKVYSEMGFDRFLSIDDFPEDAPKLHSGLTDATTYQAVLDQLRSSDQPQFVMDVTMQNHGGYDFANIPDDRMTNYDPEGFADEEDFRLNVYLSCIQAADEDLAWFIGELRNMERPVVLVFFGDHHPGLSNVYNDRFFPDEDELVHKERVYQTSYIMWANYDVAGNPQTSQIDDVGTDALGALTLNAIGAPLSDYQKAQLSVHERLNIINGLGYRGDNGQWHAPGTFPSLDTTYRDMAMMDYLRFGSKFS